MVGVSAAAQGTALPRLSHKEGKEPNPGQAALLGPGALIQLRELQPAPGLISANAHDGSAAPMGS